MDKLEITGCRDCPFRNRGHNFDSCNIATDVPSDLLYDKDVNLNVVPQWCPLKTYSITISFRINNVEHQSK